MSIFEDEDILDNLFMSKYIRITDDFTSVFGTSEETYEVMYTDEHEQHLAPGETDRLLKIQAYKFLIQCLTENQQVSISLDATKTLARLLRPNVQSTSILDRTKTDVKSKA